MFPSRDEKSSRKLPEWSEEINSSDAKWVISIKKDLEEAWKDHAACSKVQSIYRVPCYLGGDNDKAYVPQIVSLGPYHRGNACVLQMDRHKLRCLHQILERTNQDLKIYLDSIRELEEMARAFYVWPTNLSSNEFVEMLVLDGCFVLELFQGTAGGFKQLGYPQDDPIFTIRGSMLSIQRDMILLENQVPLFVLDRLLELQLPDSYRTGQVAKLMLRFFEALGTADESLGRSARKAVESSRGHENISYPSWDRDGLHCLDVFRKSLLRASRPPPHEEAHANSVALKRQNLIRCVTELREAGVRFRKRNSHALWDIKFDGGILWIPPLLVKDVSRSLFLNLIAFEQCHLPSSKGITSYVIFMDNLINSREDVRHLQQHGIIEHWLGSEDQVVDLFSRLCAEAVFDVDGDLLRLTSEINGYCNRRWNVWRASLVHNYFKTRWAIIPLVAAIVLLLLTFVQSFYGVYGYYRPRH